MLEASVLVSIDATSGTNARAAASYVEAHTSYRSPVSTMPTAISAGQAYYWKYIWQAGERASRDDIAAGRTQSFPNGEEAIRWLLSDED